MTEVINVQGAKCERITFGKNDTDFLLITMDNGNRYILDGRVKGDQDMMFIGSDVDLEIVLRDLQESVKFTDESGIVDAYAYRIGKDETVIIRGVSEYGDLSGSIYADYNESSDLWTVTGVHPYGVSRKTIDKFNSLIGTKLSSEDLGDRLREIR